MRLYILLLFFFIFPSFFGYTSLGTGQLIYTVACFSFTLCILLIPLRKVRINYPFRVVAVLLFVTTLYYLLITVASGIDRPLSVGDFKEFFRPVLYLLYFSIPFFFKMDEDDIYRLLRQTRYLILLLAFIDILKFTGFGAHVFHLYNSNDVNNINYIRFSGTFSFSYNYGFVLVFYFFYSFFEKKYLNKGSFWYCLIFFLLIVLTGSRAILFGYLFLMFVLFLFYSNFKQKILSVLLIVLIGVPLYFYLIELDNPLINSTLGYVERMILALSGEGYDASLGTRQSQLEGSMSLFSDNILFGDGPNKEGRGTIEILIAYYLSTWGIIGILLYFAALFVFYYFSIKVKGVNGIVMKVLCVTNVFWLLMIFFAGMSTPITDQIRVHQLFYFIQGLILSQWKYSEKSSRVLVKNEAQAHTHF